MSSETGSVRFSGVDKWFEPYTGSNFPRAIPGRLGEPKVRPDEGTLALDGVDLEIPSGQAIGIVGHNGAGKSTLLRVLAGIHLPTRGEVEVSGSLAAIIELGVGFHPDLTGWENLRLAAALRRIPRGSVRAFIDDVVEFSGLGSALDLPLKHYSTGMAARLGFSVATHGRADILAIDEAIAVGDREFQVRCIERIRMLQGEGATILFVSHDLWLVTQLCERAVVLEHGRVIEDGDPAVVVPSYLTSLGELRSAEGAGPTRGGGTIRRLEVLTPVISTGDHVAIEVEVAIDDPEPGEEDAEVDIETSLTLPPFGPWAVSRDPLPADAGSAAVLRIETEALQAVGRGDFGVSVALRSGNDILDRATETFRLDGEDRRKPFLAVPLEHRWTPAGEAHVADPLPAEHLAEAAIRVTGLTKRFDDIERRRIRRALPLPIKPTGAIALDRVNFSVAPGGFVGLIGPNGAGKSTLLKVIAGITRGVEGTVEVNGKLVSMIELGVGFHPDLTADENLFLAGQLLGLDGPELEAIYDEVVDFAGVGHAMSEPIKHFSTGMKARLGFALASHVPTDILLVDEMLSVGDMEFRERAVDRMELLSKGGTTIVLVSHDLRLVAEVCNDAVLLSQGRVIDAGPAHEVVDRFGGTDLEQADPLGLHEGHHEGSLRLSDIVVEPRVVAPDGEVTITAVLETTGPIEDVRIDLCIAEPFTPDWVRSGDSNEVHDRSLTADSISTGDDLFSAAGRWDLTATVGCHALRPGTFDIAIIAVEELSGAIMSEARRQIRVRGRAGDRVGMHLATKVEVVG